MRIKRTILALVILLTLSSCATSPPPPQFTNQAPFTQEISSENILLANLSQINHLRYQEVGKRSYKLLGDGQVLSPCNYTYYREQSRLHGRRGRGRMRLSHTNWDGGYSHQIRDDIIEIQLRASGLTGESLQAKKRELTQDWNNGKLAEFYEYAIAYDFGGYQVELEQFCGFETVTSGKNLKFEDFKDIKTQAYLDQSNRYIERIQALIKDADKRGSRDERIEAWLNLFKEITTKNKAALESEIIAIRYIEEMYRGEVYYYVFEKSLYESTAEDFQDIIKRVSKQSNCKFKPRGFNISDTTKKCLLPYLITRPFAGNSGIDFGGMLSHQRIKFIMIDAINQSIRLLATEEGGSVTDRYEKLYRLHKSIPQIKNATQPYADLLNFSGLEQALQDIKPERDRLVYDALQKELHAWVDRTIPLSVDSISESGFASARSLRQKRTRELYTRKYRKSDSSREYSVLPDYWKAGARAHFARELGRHPALLSALDGVGVYGGTRSQSTMGTFKPWSYPVTDVDNKVKRTRYSYYKTLPKHLQEQLYKDLNSHEVDRYKSIIMLLADNFESAEGYYKFLDHYKTLARNIYIREVNAYISTKYDEAMALFATDENARLKRAELEFQNKIKPPSEVVGRVFYTTTNKRDDNNYLSVARDYYGKYKSTLDTTKGCLEPVHPNRDFCILFIYDAKTKERLDKYYFVHGYALKPSGIPLDDMLDKNYQSGYWIYVARDRGQFLGEVNFTNLRAFALSYMVFSGNFKSYLNAYKSSDINDRSTLSPIYTSFGMEHSKCTSFVEGINYKVKSDQRGVVLDSDYVWDADFTAIPEIEPWDYRDSLPFFRPSRWSSIYDDIFRFIIKFHGCNSQMVKNAKQALLPLTDRLN